MKFNNECVLCEEIKDKAIYILPCLHEICSDCLGDLEKDSKNNYPKYYCIVCHEQFNFQDLDRLYYSDDFFKHNIESKSKSEFKFGIENEKNVKMIKDLVEKTTISISDLNFILRKFIEFKNEVETNYQKILDYINYLDFFYDDLKEQLLDQRKSLLKTDLKTIDLEIENVELLLKKNSKYLSILDSINLTYFKFYQIEKFLNFIKPYDTYQKMSFLGKYFDTKSFVKKKVLDHDYLEIINEPVHLAYNHCHLNPLFLDLIPSTVTHYTIYSNVYQNLFLDEGIKNCIPISTTHLKFGLSFNQDIKNHIPRSVTHIIFGDKFNQKLRVDSIPDKCTHLCFGCDFNQDIKDCIPNSVTHLTLGQEFNQNIKDCIPSSVKNLKIYFDRDIKDYFPNTITHLTFASKFTHNIKNYIPNSVTHLTFLYNFKQNTNDCIPNSVTHLKFDWDYNQNILGYVPNSVTHLKFGAFFNQNIKGCIPNSVTHLIFGDDFNQNIKDCIPDSVTHLELGHSFNQDIKDSIPNSVTHLTFGRMFNKSIVGCIPESVTHVTLYNIHINVKDFPNTVKTIDDYSK
jgi:hypothetical protein